MACATIHPKHTATGLNDQRSAVVSSNGEIIVSTDEDERDFMIQIVEAPEKTQKDIIDLIYSQTQRIVLLVRDRLEREKNFKFIAEGDNYEN